jgi:hypothetical protein
MTSLRNEHYVILILKFTMLYHFTNSYTIFSVTRKQYKCMCSEGLAYTAFLGSIKS